MGKKDLITFFELYYVSEVWVSETFEIPENTNGIVFLHKEFVRGVIAFGDNYPLRGLDLKLDDHLKVFKAITDVRAKSFGQISQVYNTPLIKYTDSETLVSHFVKTDILRYE